MLEVAAAVIRDDTGRILVCRRGPGGHLAGYWEFPGGKIEPGETPAEALARECLEELAVTVAVGRKLHTTVYRYPEKTVRITFLAASILSGRPTLSAHAELRWAAPAELAALALCPADAGLAAKLAAEA